MKVIFSQKLAGIAGSERYLLSAIPALARRGVDARFLMIRGGEIAPAHQQFVDELARAGVPTDVVVSNGAISAASVWRFRDIVKREKPDILHTNLIHADFYGAATKASLSRPPALLSMKHGYSDSFQAANGLDPAKLRPSALSRATWLAARHADVVVSISDGLARFFTGGGLVDPRKSRVIHYGFDFSDVKSVAPPGAHRMGALQIVCVGRLVGVKQPNLLVEAMAKIAAALPLAKLVFVGDGPLRGDLERMARDLAVADKIVFAGFQPNVLDFIRDSDVLVMSSMAEGFGRTVLEAWWHARPVVCSDVPALNEIVSDGVDGLLAPAGDAAGFAAAFERLLPDAAMRQKLGAAGRAKLDANYTLDVMVDRTIALYDELIERRNK